MSNNTITSNQSQQTLFRSSGEFIAYEMFSGSSSNCSPGIIFLPGFMSDMSGDKALAIEKFAMEHGQPFVRFDYFGHGSSSGQFVDGHTGIWLKDTLAVLDELTKGPQILVGSSMGGWLMLLTALARPERIAGLIGIAAAPDFTEDLLKKELTTEQMSEIYDKGFVICPSNFENDYIYTKALFNEGRKHLVLRNEIPIDCPVRLLHGLRDESVPWETALTIQDKLRGTDVEITLVKNGDHRLSSDSDLELIKGALANLMKRL